MKDFMFVVAKHQAKPKCSYWRKFANFVIVSVATFIIALIFLLAGIAQ